ncbi:MAG: chemotaxis protein CheD [Candidatus Goldiibacteriota bacterium]
MDVQIGIGEMKVSRKKEDRLITYSLGSCLGLTIYDPAVKVGGMIHCQLPLSKMNAAKAMENPSMFVDTGIPALFEDAYRLGAQKKRIIVKIAGCTTSGAEDKIFKIGERNYIMARKLLWKNDVFISAEDIGGNLSRTMYLDIKTGMVLIKSAGHMVEL